MACHVGPFAFSQRFFSLFRRAHRTSAISPYLPVSPSSTIKQSTEHGPQSYAGNDAMEPHPFPRLVSSSLCRVAAPSRAMVQSPS